MRQATKRIGLVLLVASFLLGTGYGTMAQMPIMPDPMSMVPDPTRGLIPNPMPLAHGSFYPLDIPHPPLPPGVPDPVAKAMGSVKIPSPGSTDLNPYNYAAANPTNLGDPTGLSATISFGGLPQEITLPNNGNCGNGNNQEWQTAMVISSCILGQSIDVGFGMSCFYNCVDTSGMGVAGQQFYSPYSSGCPKGFGNGWSF